MHVYLRYIIISLPLLAGWWLRGTGSNVQACTTNKQDVADLLNLEKRACKWFVHSYFCILVMRFCVLLPSPSCRNPHPPNPQVWGGG